MKIKSGNCIIRSWEAEDAVSIAEYANNYKIWLNLRDAFPHPYTLEDARQFIENVIKKTPETFFAITLQDKAIGSIGFSVGQDVHRFSAELGYWLAEPFWNQGIMTKVIQDATEYIFEEFRLKRIYAEPYSTNHASCQILLKAGFKKEGLLKANVFKDGKFSDQYIYARIKT